MIFICFADEVMDNAAALGCRLTRRRRKTDTFQSVILPNYRPYVVKGAWYPQHMQLLHQNILPCIEGDRISRCCDNFKPHLPAGFGSMNNYIHFYYNDIFRCIRKNTIDGHLLSTPKKADVFGHLQLFDVIRADNFGGMLDRMLLHGKIGDIQVRQ